MLLTKSIQEANEKKSKIHSLHNMVIVFPTLEPCSVFGNSIYYFCIIHILVIKTITKL